MAREQRLAEQQQLLSAQQRDQQLYDPTSQDYNPDAAVAYAPDGPLSPLV